MIYATLMQAAEPLLRAHLARRARRGKEIPDRLTERRGIASMSRPEGTLAWFHAASVGEAVALLALIDAMLARFPTLHALVTTGTVTSSRIVESRLPPRSIHQFIPLDHPQWITAFLGHWKPDLAIWTEAEIWPNFLHAMARRRIPSAMVNARLSQGSARRWHLLGHWLGRLLTVFEIRLAQSPADAARLSSFGPVFTYAGNLKWAVDTQAVDETIVAGLRRAIAGRPFWLAASTHPGEEAIAIAVHRELCVDWPNLLTIIVPRHPERGPEIMRLAEREHLCIDRRSQGALPDQQTELYLADTLGELGILYALSPIVFIGGSFTPGIGIHSPVEAVRHGAAIVHGPDLGNNAGPIELLSQAGGALLASDADALAKIVALWLNDPEAAQSTAAAASRVLEAESNVVDRIMEALEPVFRTAELG